MEPNFQRLLDKMTGLNRRFDNQDAKLASRFDELERSLAARDAVVDMRIGNLSCRFCDLEAAPADPQVNTIDDRLAKLESSFADRDAEFDGRIVDLESLRTAHIKDERDARVEELEEETQKLNKWRPTVNGVLDDILASVRKLEATVAPQVFDEMPPGVVRQPSAAAARSSAGPTATLPVVGRRVEQLTRHQGSGVITTWIPGPANGTSSIAGFPVSSSSNLRQPSLNCIPHYHPPPQPDPPQSHNHPAMIAYPPPRPPPPPDKHSHYDPKGRIPKVDFPRFDGDNPRR